MEERALPTTVDNCLQKQARRGGEAVWLLCLGAQIGVNPRDLAALCLPTQQARRR